MENEALIEEECFNLSNLSNEELISIILKTGTKEVSVKDLSTSIISKYSDISNLKDLEIIQNLNNELMFQFYTLN